MTQRSGFNDAGTPDDFFSNMTDESQMCISWVPRDKHTHPEGIFWEEFEIKYNPKWHILQGYKKQMEKMWS